MNPIRTTKFRIANQERHLTYPFTDPTPAPSRPSSRSWESNSLNRSAECCGSTHVLECTFSEICPDGSSCAVAFSSAFDLGDLSLGKLLVRDCLLLQKLLVCRKLLLGKLFICSNQILIQLAVRCKLLLARTLYLRNLPEMLVSISGHLLSHGLPDHRPSS